ncbi:MAG: helix-turn-helix domain-containing protein [Lachnospiraceae bacterium]|nr:helix-turn-helix domain-containing protein [Lachnospiraceae bacterium]
MKLNTHILLLDLQRINKYQLASSYLECNLTGYTIYSQNITLQNNIIYIISSSSMLGKLHTSEISVNTKSKNICFICLGCTSEIQYNDAFDYLIMEENVTLHELLLKLEEIFKKYDDWNKKLLFSQTHLKSISDLCNISLPVFGNPIMVHNKEYELLGHAQSPGCEFEYELKQHGSNYLNAAVTAELFLRPDYLKAMEYTTPEYWLDDDDKFLSIYINIFDDNQQYYGRIIVDGVNWNLRDGHLSLLMVLADAVRTLAIRQMFYKPGSLNLFKKYALQYFQSPQSFSRERLALAMDMNGWNRNDGFFCVCAETTSQREQINSIAYESMLFDHYFNSFLSLKWNNLLFLICNLEIAQKNSKNAYSNLAYITRENLYKSGVSTCFTDFYNFPDYFLQAQAALLVGREIDSTKWLFRFEDYALFYITHYGSHSLPLKTFIPGYIVKLWEYDKNHETAYLETLEKYIEFDAHTEKAIETLYIHRNTFNSRMKKIREIITANLDSYEERLYLMIIFRILHIHPNLLESKNR